MQLGLWGLQCEWIILILSIFFVLIDAINYVDRINHINRIDTSILNSSALQLKDNSNDPTNSGMTFWGKKGKFSRLLAFTSIWKYFVRSVWEINKITLEVMTSNSPRDKILPFGTVGVGIFSQGKKGITIIICNLSCKAVEWGCSQRLWYVGC